MSSISLSWLRLAGVCLAKNIKLSPFGNRHHGIHALQIGLSQSYCRILSVTASCPTIKLLLVFVHLFQTTLSYIARFFVYCQKVKT